MTTTERCFGEIDTSFNCAIVKLTNLFSFIVHANASFNVVEDPYYRDLISSLRPMYKVPSRYVLSGTILSAEAARINLIEMERLESREGLTLLVDGWEDIAKQSLYGTVLTEVGKHPVVLGLSDLTGKRASADTVFEVCNASLQKMCITAKQISALCTDNPSVMIKLRREWEKKFQWVIVSLCLILANL